MELWMRLKSIGNMMTQKDEEVASLIGNISAVKSRIKLVQHEVNGYQLQQSRIKSNSKKTKRTSTRTSSISKGKRKKSGSITKGWRLLHSWINMSAEPKRNSGLNKTCYDKEFYQQMATPEQIPRDEFGEDDLARSMSMIVSGEYPRSSHTSLYSTEPHRR